MINKDYILNGEGKRYNLRTYGSIPDKISSILYEALREQYKHYYTEDLPGLIEVITSGVGVIKIPLTDLRAVLYATMTVETAENVLRYLKEKYHPEEEEEAHQSI